MAFSGGLGAQVDVRAMPMNEGFSPAALLFSESNTRFLCEVEPQRAASFEEAFVGVALAKVGQVTGDERLVMSDGETRLIDADIYELKEAWQATLRF